MPPKKADTDSDEDSTPPSSPPIAVARRKKFNDEEEESDSDVLDSWDAEDSDVERKKIAAAAAAAEKKTAAAAEAAKKKKSKTERIAERQAARKADDSSDEETDEDEATKRQQQRQQQKEADLKHAEDLFGNVSLNTDARKKAITAQTSGGDIVELGSLPLFKPGNKETFDLLRATLVNLLQASNKKPLFSSFVSDLVVDLSRELTADQAKKLSSRVTTVSNEKMKEEKSMDKDKKKSKAQKTKTALVGGKNLHTADTSNYDDGGLADDDFM